jgi:hypothetical protein
LVEGATEMLARIFKYCELSWSDLCNIKRWFQPSAAREGFTLDSLNPSMKVAKVVNSVGQTLAFCPIESCYLVGAFIQNPEATSVEIGRGGDFIDLEIAKLAQREGVSKFVIVLPTSVPSQPGERWIRIIERQVPQPIFTGGVAQSQTNTTATSN